MPEALAHACEIFHYRRRTSRAGNDNEMGLTRRACIQVRTHGLPNR
jgi:hypothetical protein